jgi:hypothetical protein
LPEETEENHKTSVRIADVWLEVWTQHLPNLK